MRSTEASAPDMETRRGWRPVPWTLVDAVGVVVVTAVVTVVLLVLIGLLAGLGLIVPQALEPVLLPLPLILLAVVTLAWVGLRHRTIGALSGPASASAREWLVGIGWGVAAFVVGNILIGLLIQVLAGLTGIELPETQTGIRDATHDPDLMPALIAATVIVAPIAEELFFRGMLMQALWRRVGRWPAIIASGVLFAAAHMVLEGSLIGGALLFAQILPLGIFLGWLFARRGNLVAPIVVHAVFNLLTVLIMLAAAGV